MYARTPSHLYSQTQVMTQQMQAMAQQREFDSQRITGLQDQLTAWYFIDVDPWVCVGVVSGLC